MKTLAYDHQKLSTIPDPRKMISHYCTSSVGDNKDDDKSPSQTGSRKQSSEVLRPGEMVTLTDQLTMAGQKVSFFGLLKNRIKRMIKRKCLC